MHQPIDNDLFTLVMIFFRGMFIRDIGKIYVILDFEDRAL